jgi:homospermidine synthase
MHSRLLGEAYISNDATSMQISHLAKKALIAIANHFAEEGHIEPLESIPNSREAWAALGKSLGVCTLHVSGEFEDELDGNSFFL